MHRSLGSRGKQQRQQRWCDAARRSSVGHTRASARALHHRPAAGCHIHASAESLNTDMQPPITLCVRTWGLAANNASAAAAPPTSAVRRPLKLVLRGLAAAADLEASVIMGIVALRCVYVESMYVLGINVDRVVEGMRSYMRCHNVAPCPRLRVPADKKQRADGRAFARLRCARSVFLAGGLTSANHSFALAPFARSNLISGTP